MLLFDETAFAASQELLKGFGSDGRPMVVGAPFPCHLQEVGAEIKELASQAMAVCVKRCDSNEAVRGVMMIPRVPKTAKSRKSIQHVGFDWRSFGCFCHSKSWYATFVPGCRWPCQPLAHFCHPFSPRKPCEFTIQCTFLVEVSLGCV